MKPVRAPGSSLVTKSLERGRVGKDKGHLSIRLGYSPRSLARLRGRSSPGRFPGGSGAFAGRSVSRASAGLA